MSTWTEDALELWQDLVAEFGTTATYNSSTFPCLKDPIKLGYGMTLTAYDRKAVTIIDLLRTDAVANGLYVLVQQNPQSKRPIVTIDGNQYEIIRIETDNTAQPSIRLSASLKQ